MTQNIKAQPAMATKDARKSKNDSIIMDDAPLFAGLDIFVPRPEARIKVEGARGERIKKNRRDEPQQTNKVATRSMEQSIRKLKKAAPSETTAILLSVAEMCALLKISRATLVRMDNSGKLPGRIKLGGSVRFHRETVESWLQGLITPMPGNTPQQEHHG